MRNELNSLIAKNDLDAVIVFGSASDPDFSYLTYGADIQDAVYINTRDGQENVWLWFLERENVKNPDLNVNLFDRSLYHEVFERTNSRDLAELELYLKCLDFLNNGYKKIAVYGRLDFALANQIYEELLKRYPGIVIIRDRNPSLIDKLRSTKTDQELAIIKEVGRKTSSVMIETRDFICAHEVRAKKFVKKDGSPLVVGDVKRFVRMHLFANDLEDVEGMIFAPGIQGTIGHNTGEPETPITIGEPIVFDLFPRQNKGYYHDATRTWCFGHASDEMMKLHKDVLGCFYLVKSKAAPGIRTGNLQEIACDFFRKRGHPVIKDDPELNDGYNHSLGHGVGLNVHESPHFGINDKDVLSPRNVFTLEPGLYYGDRQIAMRIEDTLYIDQEGHCISLTAVPYDLVVPIN